MIVVLYWRAPVCCYPLRLNTLGYAVSLNQFKHCRARCLFLNVCMLFYVGQNRIYIHRMWPYIWWPPCQKYRMFTVYICVYMVLANPSVVILNAPSCTTAQGGQVSNGLMNDFAWLRSQINLSLLSSSPRPCSLKRIGGYDCTASHLHQHILNLQFQTVPKWFLFLNICGEWFWLPA